MLKLLEIDSSFFGEEPSISILDFSKSSGMLKKAADSRIDEFAAGIKPDANKIYVHILAMGAGEYYGANRNADYFPENNLEKYHDTFSTSPAHIFKHHINKNPDIAMGQVIFSIYNERMKRVEVIAWVDRQKGRDYVERIERGEFPATSMACHTPFDTCSICGNKARSRQEYCVHLKTELGKILPDGRKVMAINDGPLRFFDMSFVFKPADVTSSVLQKVAFSKQEPVLSSTEYAEIEGLTEKAASIKKLSELIKEVEGQVVGSSTSIQPILDRIKDPDDDVLKTLVHLDLHHVIQALAELGISPSVGFFAKLIGRKIAGENVNEVELLVKGMLEHSKEELPIPQMPLGKVASQADNSDRFYVLAAKKELTPFFKQASLFPEEILNRINQQVEPERRPIPASLYLTPEMYGHIPSYNKGYAGNGPAVGVDPGQAYLALKSQEVKDNSGLLKTLFLIGGAAVAAKWLLTQLIETTIKQQQVKNPTEPTKIVIVKSAGLNLNVSNIVKAALLKDLTPNK